MNDTPDLFGELDGFEPTTIRPATPSDSRALDRLAELDDTHLGEGPHLVGEARGEIVAAISLRDGSVLSDPFQHTLDVVALLRPRASQRTTATRVARRPWNNPLACDCLRPDGSGGERGLDLRGDAPGKLCP